MPKFRKKPVEIEAMLFSDKAAGAEILEWSGFQVALAGVQDTSGAMVPVIEIETLEGRMVGMLGDWIIRGVAGEYYPCKPDIFAATYDHVGS